MKKCVKLVISKNLNVFLRLFPDLKEFSGTQIFCEDI